MSEPIRCRSLCWTASAPGRRLRDHPDSEAGALYEPEPVAASGTGLPFALANIPPSRHSVHRDQYLFLEYEGRRQPALETLIASRVDPELLGAQVPEYRVNFIGGLWSLPRVSSERVLAGAWLALVFLRLWLPLTELILLQAVLCVFQVRYKSVREDRTLRRLVLETSARLQRRIMPASVTSPDQHWAQVLEMIRQTLSLNRLIFLERTERTAPRVKEVKALNCSLSDIDEQRRDCRRPPYTAAIKEGGPVLVEAFLKPALQGERQYVAPLVYAGEVLGFWAFGILEKEVAQLERYPELIRDFGAQLSELLYARLSREREQKREGGLLLQILRMERATRVHRTLERLVTFLDRRLGGLERVFDGLGTSSWKRTRPRLSRFPCRASCASCSM